MGDKKESKKEEIKEENKTPESGELKERKLNARQELFCQLYAGDEQFFCNGVKSYIEAYNIDISEKGAYNSARAGASENLTKPNILKRINEIIEDSGLNDAFVDKQLKKMITQDADFKAKMSAIGEYNKLKARIKNKLEVEIPDEDKKSLKDLADFMAKAKKETKEKINE